jgi:DNA repair exonuclease SbcCD nuclease subunit
MPIKLLHTSDVHLEAGLAFLGEKAIAHRKLQLQTFNKIVEKIISEKFDIFFIAGDLFDTPFPSENVKITVFDQLKKLVDNKIYVAIIAGNHDRLEPGSVYHDNNYLKLNPEYIQIFNQTDKTAWEIPALDLTVHGVSLTKQKDNSSPLDKITKSNKTKFNVALLHGSVEIGNENANNPLSVSKLKSAGFDYVALGDWHSSKKISDKPAVWYSGSPELINIDQVGSGNVLEVVIDNTVSVKETRVGSIEVLKVDLDITGLKTLNEINQKFRVLSLKDLDKKFVELNLIGLRNLKISFSTDQIIEMFKDKFYYLKLKDKSKLKLTQDELDDYPEEFLIGKYIRILESKKGEDYSQNKIIDEAIQLGVRHLQNK